MKKSLLIFSLLIGIIVANAQDTVYIYEEEIIYDTVYEINETQANPIHDTVVLQNTQTKTIHDTIVIQESKTDTVIKMVPAPVEPETHFEDNSATNDTKKRRVILDFNVGGGAWTTHCEPLFAKKHMVWNPGGSWTASIGTLLTVNLSRHVNLSLGANYIELGKNPNFKTFLPCDYPDCDYCDIDDDSTSFGYKMFFDGDSKTGTDTVGIKESESYYYVISVPFRIGYRIGKFTSYIGAEYNYRISHSKAFTYQDSDVKDLLTVHNIAATTGFRFDLNHRVAFSLNYSYGITKDMKHKASLYRQEKNNDGELQLVKVKDYDANWHTHRIEICTHIKLGKK